jgi:bacterioferritin-associated ferredoxin
VIVCHCQVVSDRRIRAEVEAGAVTVDEISHGCGAGARCGSCRPTISVLLATMVAADQVEPAA